MEPRISKHRDVVKKENFFSIQCNTGEQVTIAVDGEVILSAIAPAEGQLNCYFKRESVRFQFA